MLSYPKYKKLYDRNASATQLKIINYCYILIPIAYNQATKYTFQDCIWKGPYEKIKVLSNNNYTIGKIGTRYTQTLHRIRIHFHVPEQRMPDVKLIPSRRGRQGVEQRMVCSNLGNGFWLAN